MTPIPAERCIGARDLTEPRLSPDGQWVAFAAGGRAGPSIQVVPVAGGPERQLTVAPPPRPGRGLGGGCFDWLPDSSGVVYAAADGQLWLQRLDGSPSQRLTERATAAAAPAASPDGRRVAYVDDLQAVWCAHVDRAPGEEEPVTAGAADFVADPAWSPDGEALAWVEWDVPAMPWDEAAIVVSRRGPGRSSDTQRIESRGVQLQQPRYTPDGRLAFLSDASGWLNVWVGSAHTVDESFEHGGPAWGLGQRSFVPSPDGGSVAFCRNEGGFGRLCVADAHTGAVREVAKAVHGQLSWHGDTLVALRTGGRTPTQVVAYDAGRDGTGPWSRRALALGAYVGWEDHPALVEPQLLTAPAPDDGTPLHARLYAAPEPSGALLCWVHGGPTDQWQVTWLPRLAHWLSRGYSILVPDHRGSTGHGRFYTQALRGRWGELDVADTAALLRAAQAAGHGSPARTAVLGGSAGGLTALGVVAAHPGLARCAAVSYPVSDIPALAEATHRFEAHYNDTLVGTGAAALAAARARSPVALAHALAATPLLVFHGDADPVVPLAQSELLAGQVRAAGGDIELVVYPGEGHGFRDPANQLDEYARTASFLARHLAAAPTGQ